MPHSPEAGSPRSKCCQVWSLVRPLAGLQVALSRRVLTWSFPCARVDMVSLPLLIRTPILLDQDPSLLTSFNLRPLLEAPANADAPRGTALTHEVWGVHNSPSSSFLMTHLCRGLRQQTLVLLVCQFDLHCRTEIPDLNSAQKASFVTRPASLPGCTSHCGFPICITP